ncbi:DUF420 domain-containing protein [Solitalea sp. MAHUQ-68]|uniref:DUF420 domain-containing protein n=1 Tax=Solitalea agri TaxID=2953739 RepID=A0A9X2F3B2_9SPHI|nr:DUF420 domain-containing protein [Solitalea agri]MCO4293460.1 DUF420 domain-containing protein [Solitalea agri]
MSEKLLFRIVAGVSVFVFVVVVLLNRKVLPAPAVDPSSILILPKLNAFINGTCSILLLLSLYFIKQKNIAVHKKLNLTAFFLSSLFLVSYIAYHWLAPQEAKFGDLNGDGTVDSTELVNAGSGRTIYLIILISHIILAALVLPLVLLSFYWGLKMEVAKHRKITRWSYPIWLYVTITGVVVYLMISPYYLK